MHLLCAQVDKTLSHMLQVADATEKLLKDPQVAEVRDVKLRISTLRRRARVVYLPAFVVDYTFGSRFNQHGERTPERFQAVISGMGELQACHALCCNELLLALFLALLCSAALDVLPFCCAALASAVPCYAALRRAVLFWAVLCPAVLCWFLLCCAALHCAVSFCQVALLNN